MESEGQLNSLTTKRFIFYLSPRYFRLIFPQYKPKTKNGDLVSALNELRTSKFLTYDSNWDKIKLTKKGAQYKKLIKKLIDMKALYTIESNGIFDYRSEPGRKAILELIRFLSAKLNFSEYFRYLNLPVFESEKSNEWLNLFQTENETKIDYASNEGKNILQTFINKQRNKFKKKSNSIDKKITTQAKPIKLNTSFVKKYLKKAGLNRPEPLFNHFNSTIEPKIFFTEDRDFYVNVGELNKIKSLLDEFLIDYSTDENKWLNDYFDMLKLPTTLFGFQKSEFTFASKEIDAFLNLAIEGPKIIASQFSSINGIGDLRLITFQINDSENIVIYTPNLDYFYYFTIATNKCNFTSTSGFKGFEDFPDTFRTSRKRFGKNLERSITQKEMILYQEILQTKEKEERKTLEEKLKITKQEIKNLVNNLSEQSASLFTICRAIAQKLTPELKINKIMCVFNQGLISFNYIDSDTILTSVQKGKIEFSSKMRNLLKKIDDSMEEILDID